MPMKRLLMDRRATLRLRPLVDDALGLAELALDPTGLHHTYACGHADQALDEMREALAGRVAVLAARCGCSLDDDCQFIEDVGPRHFELIVRRQRGLLENQFLHLR